MNRPSALPPQAAQSLRLDERAVALLKAMGVDWRWPAPAAAPSLPPTANAPAASMPSAPAASVTDAPQLAIARPDAAGAIAALQLDGLDWDALQAAAAQCQSCALHAGRVGHCWGQGGRHARWLFITERVHPGASGDAPCSAEENALLQSLWRAMGLAESDVFVTALTKCQPALGLRASAADTQICLHYLSAQAQWLQPDMVVALGLPVAQALWGESKAPLAQWRGRLHQWQHCAAVVTYPLEALLRRPVDKSKLWADLCLGLDHVARQESP